MSAMDRIRTDKQTVAASAEVRVPLVEVANVHQLHAVVAHVREIQNSVASQLLLHGSVVALHIRIAEVARNERDRGLCDVEVGRESRRESPCPMSGTSCWASMRFPSVSPAPVAPARRSSVER